ncbi:MAG: sigma 54-interacting transcriptional regulator [Syntrophobacteraceae bacterium]
MEQCVPHRTYFILKAVRAMRNLSIDMYSVLDEIPLGIGIIGTDRKILFINRALEALTGFSRTDCEGLPCAHVLRFNNCFENCPMNKVGEREKFILEGDIINQDHQKIPVRVSFAPLRNARGKIAGYIETVDDLRRARNFDPEKIHPFSFGRIIGRSPQMEKIFRSLPVIAQSDSPVFITGQIGTGKDLLAEAIHHASTRTKNPFVTFRCGALPDTLVESELFGHEKGAFPGAVENKPGKFRLAQNGTLYLAEVGDLPLSLQTKLLNYLDEKTIYPMGGAKNFLADVRLVAASSLNLEQMARDGRFRKELFFRLNAVSLHLTPLKDRGGDIRLLLDHFLHSRASLLKKPVSDFSAECLKILEEYDYPGNVLELKHIVEYAVNLCGDETIGPRDLPAYLTEGFEDLGQKVLSDAEVLLDVAGADEGMDWSAVERKMIMGALVKANGRRTRAAQLLGWGRSTLWRKMKQYGLAAASADEDASGGTA